MSATLWYKVGENKYLEYQSDKVARRNHIHKKKRTLLTVNGENDIKAELIAPMDIDEFI